MSDEQLAEHTATSRRLVGRGALTYQSSFLRALEGVQGILAKGLDGIRARQCDGYYKCLLALEDLAGLHEKGDFPRYANKHFLAIAAGLLPPVLPAGEAALALEDGRVGDEVEAPAALCDQPAVAAVPEDWLAGADAAHAVPTFAIPAVVMKDGLKVHFDNCTHSSGKRRALCVCRCTGLHGPRCEKDVFVADHGGSPQRAAAWLAAWEAIGPSCANKAAHLAGVPDPGDVEARFLEIQGLP